jgi:hypothetical protein
MGIWGRPTVPPGVSLWRRAVSFTTGPYWIVVIPTSLMLVVVLGFALPARGRELADRVERGDAVRPPGGSFRSLDLHVKALPVTLTPLGQDELPAELKSRSLRYFGRASGGLILYDWKAEKVIRVPADSVVVVVVVTRSAATDSSTR